MRGVKGHSPFLTLDCFDPTIMVPIEVMHTFDLGIIPMLLNAWCDGATKNRKNDDPTFTSKRWYLSASQYQELVRRVNAVRVPHTITRKPKLETRDDWKAEGMYDFKLILKS